MTYTPPEGVSIGTFTADTLPASFNAPAGAVVSYKIYGTSGGAGVETESGEPAGYKIPILNMSGNLWNGEIEQGGINNGGSLVESAKRVRSCITNLVGGQTYFIKSNQNIRMIYAYYGMWTDTKIGLVLDNNTYKTEYTFKLPEGANSIGVVLMTYPETNIVPSDITTAILAKSSNYDLFIGDSKLGATEYLDFSEQKIYKDVAGTLTPTDPPVPLPTISTYKGENILSSTETLGDIELTGDWLAIMGSTEAESIDIGFTVDVDEYIAFATVNEGSLIQVFDTITMPSSADSFTLEVVSWGREQYTETVYSALS